MSITISHYDIFNYWKDKKITKYGKVIGIKDSKDYTDMIVVVDWGEPYCWACGRPLLSTKEEKEIHKECQTINGFDYKKLWNHKKVIGSCERAHIYPRALGGTEEPSNMFLLCPECHFDSPDTTNPTNFFRWVYRKDKNSFLGYDAGHIVRKKLNDEIESRGFDADKIIKDLDEDFRFDRFGKNKEFRKDELRNYMNKNVGCHFSRVSESSVYMAFADYLIEKWLEKTQGIAIK